MRLSAKMTCIASSLRDLLRCPQCFSLALNESGTHIQCADCRSRYPIFAGRPVLLVPDHALFPQAAYEHARPRARGGAWRSGSVNLSARRCLGDLAHRLARRRGPRVLLLGSGTQRTVLADQIDASIVAVDIDRDADVDAFADAHALPFRNGCFDAVIATAVLEHVLRPEAAMAEITRVLASDGLLYSEVPFMQQVHEGAYDFTRYTLSGHRRLAERFEEIESGAVAGPGTALMWAVEHFLLALLDGRPARRNLVKGGVRVLLGWLRTVDPYIAERAAALDGASCTYFYGQLVEGAAVGDREIVSGYRGAQRIRHV
jgi:SAM-dependent methyltransferase